MHHNEGSNEKNINTWKQDDQAMKNNKAGYIKIIITLSTQSQLKDIYVYI